MALMGYHKNQPLGQLSVGVAEGSAPNDSIASNRKRLGDAEFGIDNGASISAPVYCSQREAVKLSTK